MPGGYFGPRPSDDDSEPVLIAPGEVIPDPDRAEALGLTVEARKLREDQRLYGVAFIGPDGNRVDPRDVSTTP